MIDRVKFLEKDKLCPICKNNLSLYLSINNVGTFKYHQNLNENKSKNKFSFYPLKDNSFRLSSGVNKTDYIQFNMINDVDFSTSLSSEALFRTIEKSTMYFFYVCNVDSFNHLEHGTYINGYSINISKVCYYKASNKLTFKQHDDNYSLSLNDDTPLYIECFNISKEEENCVKNYCLTYNYYENKSNFFFSKRRIDDDFIDGKNTLRKELEILDYYPNFSNKDKIIEKFESWILIS